MVSSFVFDGSASPLSLTESGSSEQCSLLSSSGTYEEEEDVEEEEEEEVVSVGQNVEDLELDLLNATIL